MVNYEAIFSDWVAHVKGQRINLNADSQPHQVSKGHNRYPSGTERTSITNPMPVFAA